MKGLLTVFVFTALLYANAAAQDSNMQPQGEAGQPGSSSKQMSDGPALNSSLPHTAHASYGSEGYGGRAEVFVDGFGVFGSRASGNGIVEQETDAGGAAVGYRFHLNASSALEGRYGFSRDSQKYTIGGSVSSIPSYFSEITGSYVYTFGKSQRVRPYLLGGGGVALFIPGHYGAPTNTASAIGSSAGPSGIPAGYALPKPHAEDVLGPVYTASSTGVGTQARGMFLYGVGAEIPASSHFYFRTEFRGLGYKAPDFTVNALHTNAFSLSYEPSLGLAYRF